MKYYARLSEPITERNGDTEKILTLSHIAWNVHPCRWNYTLKTSLSTNFTALKACPIRTKQHCLCYFLNGWVEALVDAYGLYADSLTDAMIKKLVIRR